MEKNEIKKVLYKENPKAKMIHIRGGNAYYTCETSIGTIVFEVPVSDMGDADFYPEMDGKFLIRWVN